MLPDWRLAVVLQVSRRRSAGRLDRRRSGRRAVQPDWALHVRRYRDLASSDDADGKPSAHLPQHDRDGAAGRCRDGRARGPRRGNRAATVLRLRQIPKVQGALVSLDPSSGRVLAMVGGWSFDASQFNRATQAQRQPGSSFKPIVYLTALEKGISPSDRFLDAPIVIDQGAAGVWRPHNYEGNFGGPTSLRVALEQSLNLVTLRVAQRIGMEAVAKTAEGFRHGGPSMPNVLPAALGAVDTTVLREAGAMPDLDEGGREVIPTLIDSVQDREGHVVWRPSGVDCACDEPSQSAGLTDDRAADR